MNTKALHKLHRAVDEFRKLDPQFPVQGMTTFLYIAMHPGCTLDEIMKGCGITQASVSRNVAMLGKWHRTGRPGHDLVIPSLDLRPRARGHIVNLTPKGRLVAAAFNGLMEE